MKPYNKVNNMVEITTPFNQRLNNEPLKVLS